MAEYMGYEGLTKSQVIGTRGVVQLAKEHNYDYELFDDGKIKIITPDGSRTFGPNVKAGTIGKFLGYAEGGAVMQKQMEMFEEGDLSTAKDDAIDKLDSGVKELRADRKQQFDKMTEMLTSGAVNDMTLEQKENFVQLYKMLKQHHNFAEGGLLEDGGLMDEGGTVDPVSGNDVPPGSTQEEVRDDIPAQLSEGEFVFPADVVRYIGLGNLMRMRQEAKMGLKLMDEMGQMGNSDEASMPDDMPFDINDLDMEDEPEYNVGGFVPAQQQQQFGIAGYTPAAQPTTGYYQAPFTQYGQPQQPVQAASQQFVQPTTPVAQAPVPTMQDYQVPEFSEFVGGGFGEYDELREYRNEAGNVMMIPFKDGSPISPIPEGYTFYDPEQTKTEDVTTTPTTVQTERVLSQDELRDRDDADAARRQADMDRYGTADNKIGLMDFYGPGKDLIYGVNYVDGFGMGIMGVGQVLKGTIGGGDFPKGAMIMLKNGDDEILLTGEEYTKFRNVVKEKGTDYSEILDLMEKGRIESAKAKAAKVKKEEKRQSVENILAGTEDDDGGYKGTGESYDISQKGPGLESSLRGSSSIGEKGTSKGRQDYSGGIREDSDPAPASQPQQDDDSGSSITAESVLQRMEGDDVAYDIASDYSDFGTDFGDTAGDFYFNQGGLAGKPKPKAKKKMKRGGLASKK